jgi:nondiscriminating glutamyl-tRNA synthetase
MTDKEEKIEEIRTRFAPSPTGPIHIGSIRTALFNYLFARKNHGKFILRVEDTDVERSKPEWEHQMIKIFEWLKLEWDEGPLSGQQVFDFDNYKINYVGPHAPYRQSERKEIYKKYLQRLLDEGKAYYCFCDKEAVEAQKQYLMSMGQPPIYMGTCRDLSKEQVGECFAQGKSAVIRFKCPVNHKIIFEDIIKGKVEFNSDVMGDFVIAKDLENPLYNFTVVVDDAEMEINYVIRGDEHLPNAPKQILLIEALGLPQPNYAHMPLILGENKKKLSKRDGKTSVVDYKEDGYLPEALINFIAFLGWNPGTEKEIYTIDELINDFSLEKIQKSGAIFNIDKLDWINGFYIRKMPVKDLTEALIPYFKKAEFITEDDAGAYIVKETGEEITFNALEKIVLLYQERLKKLSEIIELTDLFFKKDLVYEPELLNWKQMPKEELIASLKRSDEILSGIDEMNFNKEYLEKAIMPEAEKMANRGNLLWPLRVALTGKKNSAGPMEIAEALGKKESKKRIEKAILLIS